MNNSEHISQLIYRYITGSITDDEWRELKEWLDASGKNREAFSQLTDISFLEKEYSRQKAVNCRRAMADMTARVMHDSDGMKSRWKTIAIRISQVAAAVLLVCGAYIYYNKVEQALQTVAVTQTKGNVITHGSTKAMMTLDNGEVIPLSDNAETNRELMAKADGYEDVKEIKLATPRGGEFKITLEDGTEVWLNADTQLCYPESFDSKERRVAVTGEAYFKVAKDVERPFYVETAGQLVRVYGTEFNVHAYSEDADVATTLVTGSVALSQLGGNGSEMLLTPGHQALFDKSSAETHIKSVDTSVVTSWRSGRFVFEDQTLEQIMQTLSRWYDFDYAFQNPELSKTLFMGSIPRYGEFSEVLSILEKSGGLKFRQKGHTIVIMRR